MTEEMVHAKPRSREEIEAGSVVDREEVARIVVDQAYHIHCCLGPGLLESVYEMVLAGALARTGLRVERQKPVSINYDGMAFADAFRIDLLVENTLIVEIKSVELLSKIHGKQLLTYLRLTEQPLGLLINFGAATFREGIRRVVNDHTSFVSSRLRVNQLSSTLVQP